MWQMLLNQWGVICFHLKDTLDLMIFIKDTDDKEGSPLSPYYGITETFLHLLLQRVALCICPYASLCAYNYLLLVNALCDI